MDITLKKAGIEDLDSLVNLFNQYMIFYKQPSNEEKYKSYLNDRLKNREATVYMALDPDNYPAGFVLNYYSFSSVSQGILIFLNDLFDAPDYRKKGIAELLINASFNLAREVGAIRVDLGTAKDNFNAQRLYEKIGFVRDNEFFAYSFAIE